MSYKMIQDPDTFCATCLSQGRKMFPVKFTRPFSITYKDLALTEKDQICWECNHFILKMTIFRSKVMRAKTSLTALLNRQATQLHSLSKLSNSTGIYLEIPPPLEDPIKAEPLFVNVGKSEIDSDPEASNVCDENFEVFYHETRAPIEKRIKVIDENSESIANATLLTLLTRTISGIQPSFLETKIPIQAPPKPVPEQHLKSEIILTLEKSPEKLDSDPEASNVCDENFEVFYHETRAPIEKRIKVIDENSESIANATLLTLLTRTSIQPSFLETKIPIQAPPKPVPEQHLESEIILTLEKSPEKLLQNPEEPKLQNVEVFTEEKLTEEEMLKWWESKTNIEFYQKSIPVFRCEKCVEPFCTRRSFLAHIKRHTMTHGELACSICDLRFMTEAALAAHRANHYRILKCAYCPHKWDSPNSMRVHCSTAHGVPVTAWSCELCPREFPSLYKLLCHARSHRLLECDECGKRVSVAHSRVHKLSHERGPEKPHACEKCGRKFQLECNLKKHMQIHDTELDENAYCAECNKQFRDMMQYNNHMKYAVKHVSADVLRYKCDDCGQGFPHKVALRRHIEAKHSDQRNYRCGTCPTSFKSRQARRAHQRLKHEGYVAPRDHMCDYCGKAFRTKRMLSEHTNTHTGSRPFACELCGATFGFKSALYLHKRFKHKVQKKSTKGVKTDQ